MELVVLNTSGKETGRTVAFDETVFGIEPNQHAVYLEVNNILLRKDKVLINQKKEAKLLLLQESLRSKKDLVLHVMVILNLQLSKEG